MASISIDAVTKSYGTLQVLHGIDVAVRDGEFLILVGPSGCGKSTLLRMIAGLESISSGTMAGIQPVDTQFDALTDRIVADISRLGA